MRLENTTLPLLGGLFLAVKAAWFWAGVTNQVHARLSGVVKVTSLLVMDESELGQKWKYGVL